MPDPEWVEATLRVDPVDVDAVGDVLREAGAEGVAIEPAIRISDSADFVYEELDAPSTVRATFRAPFDIAARRTLRRRLGGLVLALPLPPMRYRAVEPSVWAEEWRRFYHVQHIGDWLVVRPTWEPYEAAPHEVVLALDPGAAFGTGQHETTRLCLLATERHLQAGWDVLDIGAGSGILAIAAAMLGAHDVLGMDTDAATVSIAEENAARNGVARIRFAAGSLGDQWPWPDRPLEDCADLVISNISSTVVEAQMPDIARATRPGGVAVLSGFIERDAEEVTGVAREAGLRPLRLDGEGEWRCLTVGRPR
ncbi:MAG: 50S ribosomal protein L11 methyltransferase [Dehalococcoidia bacterium]